MIADEGLIPNGVRAARLAAGIGTPEDVAASADLDPVWYGHIEAGRVLPTASELERITAALGGVPAGQLYPVGYLGLMGTGPASGGSAPSALFRGAADQCHMLVARDEVTWFERPPGAGHRVEVFVNLSCGTQRTPHLLLDTVAVLERLGVSFVAAAGPAACCGKPFLNVGRTEAGERVNRSRIERSLGWGARTHVNWCSACQVAGTTAAARRFHAEGVEHPVREVQVLTFLGERVRELGESVPWATQVHRRVLVEGHPALSEVQRHDQLAAATLLALVPGVEVVDLYDGHADESPCAAAGRERGWTPPAWCQRQATIDGVREHRDRLARHVRARGADTVSCQHQGCHSTWSRYASESLAVRHAVSIVAEALGCSHPDRYQAAVRLGDPDAFVAQTRPVWQSWGMSEQRARDLAASMSDPIYADAAVQCSCGVGDCQKRLISVDVLAGALRPTTG